MSGQQDAPCREAVHDCVNNLSEQIEKQLIKAE